MSMAAHISPPPLREGDQLTSDEFMRRWEAMPDLKYAELIDGIVHMPSPVSIQHADLQVPLGGWLTYYASSTRGCWPSSEGTWLMGEKSVPQPDITLRILPEHGGQSHVEGDYPAGAPELVVEVATSSRARDLGVKLKLYERMGVREYLVVDTRRHQVHWKELIDGRYHPLEPGADGLFRSRCFPGLWLDPEVLWSRDLPRLFSAVQQGLATSEHAVFVARLAAARPVEFGGPVLDSNRSPGA